MAKKGIAYEKRRIRNKNLLGKIKTMLYNDLKVKTIREEKN